MGRGGGGGSGPENTRRAACLVYLLRSPPRHRRRGGLAFLGYRLYRTSLCVRAPARGRVIGLSTPRSWRTGTVSMHICAQPPPSAPPMLVRIMIIKRWSLLSPALLARARPRGCLARATPPRRAATTIAQDNAMSRPSRGRAAYVARRARGGTTKEPDKRAGVLELDGPRAQSPVQRVRWEHTDQLGAVQQPQAGESSITNLRSGHARRSAAPASRTA